jgi:hypothetical protein
MAVAVAVGRASLTQEKCWIMHEKMALYLLQNTTRTGRFFNSEQKIANVDRSVSVAEPLLVPDIP